MGQPLFATSTRIVQKTLQPKVIDKRTKGLAFPADKRPGGGAALGSIDSAGGGGREDILVRSVACWVLISSVLLPVCTGFTGSVSWVGRT